jgi:hypothetical protein
VLPVLLEAHLNSTHDFQFFLIYQAHFLIFVYCLLFEAFMNAIKALCTFLVWFGIIPFELEVEILRLWY